MDPTPPTQPQVPTHEQHTQHTEMSKPKKHKHASKLRGIFSTLVILVLAPVIALVLTAFVFQSYEVEGVSMETTLQNHDRLIVLKVPRTISRLTGHAYIPHRGDIIILVKHNLVEGGQIGDKQLVKRVIGLPGDRVVVSEGVVTVYNNDHPNGFSPDKTLPYGSVITSTIGEVDVTVPEGQVFVCGDNRGNSLDSRSFGTVPSKDIVGKLLMRIYPLNNTKSF